MLIQVTNAERETYWYSSRIGCAYMVELVKAEFAGRSYSYDVYQVIEGSHKGDYIWPCDAEVSNNEKH